MRLIVPLFVTSVCVAVSRSFGVITTGAESRTVCERSVVFDVVFVTSHPCFVRTDVVLSRVRCVLIVARATIVVCPVA